MAGPSVLKGALVRVTPAVSGAACTGRLDIVASLGSAGDLILQDA
jgi:hypothetical protein